MKRARIDDDEPLWIVNFTNRFNAYVQKGDIPLVIQIMEGYIAHKKVTYHVYNTTADSEKRFTAPSVFRLAVKQKHMKKFISIARTNKIHGNYHLAGTTVKYTF